MRVIIYISILITFCSACNDIDLVEGAPKCLQNTIKAFKNLPLCAEASVDEYTFQQTTVYVLGVGNCCCDRSSEVVDDRCNQIGFLGGFTGNTIINGEEFSNAIYIRTIWTND